jgi:hypothetical protein
MQFRYAVDLAEQLQPRFKTAGRLQAGQSELANLGVLKLSYRSCDSGQESDSFPALAHPVPEAVPFGACGHVVS